MYSSDECKSSTEETNANLKNEKIKKYFCVVKSIALH